MYSAIHVIHFEIPTEAIKDQSNIIHPNCIESHSEVFFLSSFLYLRPYALTRDNAEAYDVSLFYFLMFIIIFSHLVWLSFDREKTDVRIRWW